VLYPQSPQSVEWLHSWKYAAWVKAGNACL
jgi:hypothetical protein